MHKELAAHPAVLETLLGASHCARGTACLLSRVHGERILGQERLSLVQARSHFFSCRIV